MALGERAVTSQARQARRDSAACSRTRYAVPRSSAGAFDLSASPAGGISPNGGVLDSTFQQYALVAEIEKRYELWGQPGKFKVTGFLNRGRAGKFQDAISLAQVTGDPADIHGGEKVYTAAPASA